MTGFSADGYWTKTLLFINRALEPDSIRSEDERRLWASLALEQLAKWALARTSPTLVADPVRADGDQLFRALGLREGGPYVSITASTAFKRCAAIYRPFSDTEAAKFANARNEYLHGTEVALLTLPAEAWWSRFWSLVNVLLSAHQLGPDSLVGSDRATEVEEHLSRNAQHIKHRFEALVDAARRTLNRYEAGLMLADEAARWKRTVDLAAWLKYKGEAECPACGAVGTAESDIEDSKDVVWSGDPDVSPYIEVTFTPDYFSCPQCHLVLDNYELVAEGDLADQITMATDDPIYEEGDYGND
ncbi:hypothetical protein GXB85_13495 [Cellulomonas sp. APG4]|uniref:hypothetical protein n=1 Tax=Cellulomonas sp. APG4 TaxID=1538656 RepID=UPI00137B1E7B|nr:hypothetical protein [Cellulomonas sp. APG4]NCT91956.1 hypothetical protein [Cellulomonas sp. APG4]